MAAGVRLEPAVSMVSANKAPPAATLVSEMGAGPSHTKRASAELRTSPAGEHMQASPHTNLSM